MWFLALMQSAVPYLLVATVVLAAAGLILSVGFRQLDSKAGTVLVRVAIGFGVLTVLCLVTPYLVLFLFARPA